MRFALFVSIPLVGHINPLFRQAEALQRRGWRVAVASTSEMAAHAARESAVPFLNLGSLGDVAGRLRADQERASRDGNLARGTLGIVRGLFAAWPAMFDGLTKAIAADRPDVMVVDLFTAAGLCAGDAAGVPCVINNADVLGSISVKVLPPADDLPMLFSGTSRHAVSRLQPMVAPILRPIAAWVAALNIGADLNRQRRTRGLPKVDLHERFRDRTILVNGVFGLEYERPLPASIVMTGPMLPSSPPPLPDDMHRWLADGPPVVYANFGTLATLSPAQLAAIERALTSPDFRALWIRRGDPAHAETGARHRRSSSGDPADPKPVPGTVRVMPWGPPPLAVLAHPNVKVFVTHSGVNSVYESIVAGTPMVGIPMFADQRDMAVRAADAGVGLWFDKQRLDAAALTEGIARVVREPSFTARLAPIQEAIARAGGVGRAADLIAAAARS